MDQNINNSITNHQSNTQATSHHNTSNYIAKKEHLNALGYHHPHISLKDTIKESKSRVKLNNSTSQLFPYSSTATFSYNTHTNNNNVNKTEIYQNHQSGTIQTQALVINEKVHNGNVNQSDINNSYNTHNNPNASNGTTAHSKNSMFFLNKKKSLTTEKVKTTKDLSLLKLNEKTSGKIEVAKKNYGVSNISSKKSKLQHQLPQKKKSLPGQNTLKYETMSRTDMMKALLEQDINIMNLNEEKNDLIDQLNNTMH